MSRGNSQIWPVTDDEGYYQSVKSGNQWMNYWSINKPGTLSAAKLLLDPDRSNVPRDERLLNATLPVLKPHWIEGENESGLKGCEATWLGHASVLAHIDDVTILTDPIFSDYASPIQGLGYKRIRPPPCSPHQLPRKLDAVVISHSHYDHLDSESVIALNKKYGDSLLWFVPSGLGPWMKSYVANVEEFVWWQSRKLKSSLIVFTPANHWSRRGLFDENKTLWGSWTILGPKHKFFFAGDTAYESEVFKQIRRRFGSMDLSAIPIGAYEPRWFMKWNHVNPQEALTIHEDLESKNSFGIHWGTFTLTHEPYMEPKETLENLMSTRVSNYSSGNFITLRIGDTLRVE